MGFAKNLIVGILNLLLIISLSTFVISLAFTLTINERSLNALIDNNLKSFVDEQIDQSFTKLTSQELDAQHKYALSVCEKNKVFEIGQQGNDTITLDCNKVKGTTSDQFLKEMKGAIAGYTMNTARNALDKSTEPLKYATILLWISIIFSFILAITISLLVWGFPFKAFGATGLIVGSPFIILLFSKPLISNKIQQEIQSTVSPEIFEQLSRSTLVDGITGLISNLFFDMVVGFAILFFVGLILLLIGFFIKKKSLQVFQDRNV